ncbi:fungal-specific transcription factor domain-containing protein [Podospora didyma]|uniref:Fungal-specific transcription factor domain-containing protein n=1 Tax=Podospora didyma TaxID=330526 RepID=A0AAE0TVR9_9PEZI|nr:fungal-specific transcription factor domain-containing protein [Podospora didyma]
MPKSQDTALQKRCWNCRSRKTACDRAVPACSNCRKRGQECQGYGLKLSWPRINDERRAVTAQEHLILPVRAKTLEFVNASSRDIEIWKGENELEHSEGKQGGKSMSLSLTQSSREFQLPRLYEPYMMGFAELDPFLDTKKFSAVSRIITTACDEMGDLYQLLVRISLGNETPPAIATRHAIAALSYQHLDQPATAYFHQTKALSALQVSINCLTQSADSTVAFQAMAASMLINIFETLIFDASSSSNSWDMFFSGAKKIANLIHRPDMTYDGDPALILDWIFYHDTLYKFSIRHWAKREEDQVMLAAQEKIVSKAVFSPMRQLILTSAGCSLELLCLMCQVTDAVLDRDDPRHLTPEHLGMIRNLELRLGRIQQIPRVVPYNPDHDEAIYGPQGTFASRLAELYRLASYIYLERMARCLPRSDEKVSSLVDQAMYILRGLGFCERPWPLFVVALEARNDEERMIVLNVLARSKNKKPLGNIPLVKRLIHSAWVQQDLQAGEEGNNEADPMLVYNTVVSGNRFPPSFT